MLSILALSLFQSCTKVDENTYDRYAASDFYSSPTGSDEKVLVLVNIRNRAVDYILPAGIANTTWTDALYAGNVSLAGKFTLQPNAYLILKNQ